MYRVTSLATAAVLLAGGLLAVPSPAQAAKEVMQPGTLHVYDGGAMFTEEAINRAKATMGNVQFDHGLHMTIDTYSAIPAGKTLPKGGEAKFFRQWAEEAARGDKAKGVYVLVCRSPGHVEVIADAATRTRGFEQADEQRLRDILNNAFKEAGKAKRDGKPDEEQFRIRDKALAEAVDFVISDLKGTHPPVVGGTKAATTTTQPTKKAGMGIGGWICLGLCVLLAIWVTVALIRALTAPAYYGGPAYAAGGGMFGGFGTAFLGGMFGVMAGMYLYDAIAGTHFHDAAASDPAYGGSSDYGNDAVAGEGDFSGDAGAGGGFDDGGGDYGGGDYGGGDYGGGDYGGGDYGGGDYGGGGGDFGGGDF